MKFAANLSMMFNEVDFMQRFEAAAKAGFNAVEYLFPYAHPANDIADALKDNQLQQVLFNMPAGDFDAGERGIAALPGREDEFLNNVNQAIEYAKTLNCPRLHAMAGLVPEGADKTQHMTVYLNNLEQAAKLCSKANIDLLIEPINPINIPHYFLNDFGMAMDVIDVLEKRGVDVKLQFDFFHCQRIHADIPAWLLRCAHKVAHFQIAGTPDRHEPNIGDLPEKEIQQAIVDNQLESLFIGCEYVPAGVTEQGLAWMDAWKTQKV